jgi:hypothetical protein
LIDDRLKRDRKLIETCENSKFSTLKDSQAIDSFKLPKILNQSKLSPTFKDLKQNEFSLNKILSKDFKSKDERIQTSSKLKEIIIKNSKSSQLDSNLFRNKTLDENNLSFSNEIDKNSTQKLNQSKSILITNILYNDQKNLSETIIDSSPISKPLIIRDKLDITKNFIERKNKSDSALITPSSCFDNIKSSFKSFTNLPIDKSSHNLEPKDLLTNSFNFTKEKIEAKNSNSKSNVELIDKKSLSKPVGFSNSGNFQVEKIKIIENQVQKEKITKILSIKSLQTLDRNQSNKDMKASVDLLLPNINQIHIKNETIQDKQIRSENQQNNNNLLSEIKVSKRNKKIKIKKVKKSNKLDSVENKTPEINIQKVTSSTELQSTNKTDLNRLINYNERNIKLKTKKIKNKSHFTIMDSEIETKSSTISNDLKKKGRKTKFDTTIRSTNDSDILEEKISEISIQNSSSNLKSREREIKLKIKKSFKQYYNNSDDTYKEIETDSDINEDNNNLKIIIQDEYSSTSIIYDSKTSINTETNIKKSNETINSLIQAQNLEINIENQASLDVLKLTNSNLNLIRFNSESNLSNNSSIKPQSSMTSLLSDFEKIINRNILNENNANAIALKFSKSDKRFIPKRMFKTGFLSELYFTPAYNFSYFDLPLDRLEFNRKHSRLLEYKEIILNIKINEKLQKSSISNNNNNSKKKLNDIIDKIFSDLKKHKEKYKKIQNFKMKPYNAYYLRNHIAEIIGSLEKYDKDFLYGKFFQEIPNINFLNLNNLKLPLL